MNFFNRFALITTSGVLASASVLTSSWSREWTSAAGTAIEAELVRVHFNNVILKKKDGKELVVPIAKLSAEDQAYLKKPTRSKSSKLNVELITKIQGSLYKFGGGKVKRQQMEDTEAVRYLAVYYSAKWCGPCRSFTPELVEFYNRHKEKHPEFEIVFVSSDRSKEEWESYVIEEQMPWYAAEYEKEEKSDLKDYGGSVIPCLVVLSSTGEVLSDSFVNGEDVGPRKVLADLEGFLQQSSVEDRKTALGSLKPES